MNLPVQRMPVKSTQSRNLPPGFSHFESLRDSLNLSPSALVGDALHFLIGPDMNVVALMSERGDILLLVELVEMKSLEAEDWQRLAMHLSAHFDDESMGRIIVLDGRLSMAWRYPVGVDIDLWVHEAQQAMAWCAGTRAMLTGHIAPIHQ
jgi:hypothetical protein